MQLSFQEGNVEQLGFFFSGVIGKGSMSQIDAASVLVFSVKGEQGGALCGHKYLSTFRYEENQVSDALCAKNI